MGLLGQKKTVLTKISPGPAKNSIVNKFSQPTHYCKLVQETKHYGSLASAKKSRWKSRGWKESQLPEPSSNVPIRCPSPGCKEVFWKQVFYEHIFQKHANLTMTPAIVSIAMYPHERNYVKSLENRGRALTSKCPKNDKNPHDCDCEL